MGKVIDPHFRYRVERDEGPLGWTIYTSSRIRWKALQIARHRTSLGFYQYRVVDSKGDS